MTNEYVYIYSLICSCIGLLCLFIWVKKSTNVNSSTISFITWLLASVFVAGAEPVLFMLTGDISLDRYVWYCSFAAINLLSVFIITKLHRIEGIKLNRDSAVICLALIVLAAIQVARLVDKEIIETFLMNEFYKTSISTLNILTWSYIVVMTYTRKSIERNNRGNS